MRESLDKEKNLNQLKIYLMIFFFISRVVIFLDYKILIAIFIMNMQRCFATNLKQLELKVLFNHF